MKKKNTFEKEIILLDSTFFNISIELGELLETFSPITVVASKPSIYGTLSSASPSLSSTAPQGASLLRKKKIKNSYNQVLVTNYDFDPDNYNSSPASSHLIKKKLTPSGYNSNRYNIDTYINFSYKKIKLKQNIPKKKYYNSPHFFPLPSYHFSKQTPTIRNDFRKTIYWNTHIKTNEKGENSEPISYYNSDEITTFRMVLEGIGKEGALARGEKTYSVQKPFNITAQIPSILSFGDSVNIAVILKNNTLKDLKGSFGYSVPKQLKALKKLPSKVTIPADSFLVINLPCKVNFEKGKGDFVFKFESQKTQDQIQIPIEIISKGFPKFHSFATQNKIGIDTFIIGEYYPNSLESQINIYTNILDGLADGLEGILRSPSGCFEQVSASNYPNILALQLMQQTGEANENTRTKALNYLTKGYQKLVAYEIKGGGFEWYGDKPAHEGLTAYGLVQFHDMKKVFDGVDTAIIERTKKYLLGRRDGKGGFRQNVGKYGFSGNKPALFNAYITWALTEVNTPHLDLEIQTMLQEATQSKDLYRMSLAALALYNTSNNKKYEMLVKSISKHIQENKLSDITAESTLTYSYGTALNLETLSFAALALMKSKNPPAKLIKNIVSYFLTKRQYGKYGSTQSTIMVLKVLTAYHSFFSAKGEGGSFVVSLNGKEILRKSYAKGKSKKITIKGLNQYLKQGENIIKINYLTGKSRLFSFDANWKISKPTSSNKCPLVLSSNIPNTTVKMGETTRLNVKIKNKRSTVIPSPMAVIGIPAGLSLQPWQLKKMQEEKIFDYYEIDNNLLILYYKEMEGSAVKNISFDLKTEAKGSFEAPANSAYLYYTDEFVNWSKGATIKVW